MMIYPNLISTTVPDKDLKEILKALKFINEKLPDLVTLTKEELTTLPKIGQNTNSFILENLKEAENNPDLVPKDIELDEIKRKPQDAIIIAAQERFRPIILTTATTICGLLPLWIGGGIMFEPLAVAILFGLLFATVITLLFVPVMYKLFFRVSYKDFVS